MFFVLFLFFILNFLNFRLIILLSKDLNIKNVWLEYVPAQTTSLSRWNKQNSKDFYREKSTKLEAMKSANFDRDVMNVQQYQTCRAPLKAPPINKKTDDNNFVSSPLLCLWEKFHLEHLEEKRSILSARVLIAKILSARI